MTRDRDFKRLIRARVGRTSESYTVARAQLRRRGLVAMTRRQLEILPDDELIMRCVAPISRRLHVADPSARHAVLRRLTGAQGALLAFWMLSLIKRLRNEIAGALAADPASNVPCSSSGLDEASLMRTIQMLLLLDAETMADLDEEYRRILPQTLRLVAARIREHANDFVSIEA